VAVELRRSAVGLDFVISDDGPGLEKDYQAGAFGLDNMRDRILAVGGRLELRSTAFGTTIAGFLRI
jgi:signal transduction histidine kinase